MGRPKKEKPNRKDGCYEVKITIGTAVDGTLIRKSFYSTKSKEAARQKAEQYKINQAMQEKTGLCFQKKSNAICRLGVGVAGNLQKRKGKRPDLLFHLSNQCGKIFDSIFRKNAAAKHSSNRCAAIF